MYTVSGFPRRAEVEILVDDGKLVDPVDAGDEVVATITIEEDGTASGAVELPAYVGLGTHWLRFRASGGPDVATSEVRTIDYTNKSPYFRVSRVTVIGGTEEASAGSTQEPGSRDGDTDEDAASQVGGSPQTPASVSDLPLPGGPAILVAGVLIVAVAVLIRAQRRRLERQGRPGTSVTRR